MSPYGDVQPNCFCPACGYPRGGVAALEVRHVLDRDEVAEQYNRAEAAERTIATLREERDWYVNRMNDEHSRADAAEQQVATLREALRDADSYLADPSGHPLDCINFARDVIRTALAAIEDGTE